MDRPGGLEEPRLPGPWPVPSQSWVHVPVPGDGAGTGGAPGPLPELVTEPLSLVIAFVDATGETSDPPQAASAKAPPTATSARNREDAFIESLL